MRMTSIVEEEGRYDEGEEDDDSSDGIFENT
jgi:hypothetical protein